MKQDFKKWLNLHKDKTLTKEIIEMISTKHEDEIHSMLFNDGLVLENVNSSRKISTGEEKDWAVSSDYDWTTEREFNTLKGAIKFSHQQ